MSVTINKEAKNLSDILLNHNWCLVQLFDRVYSITIGNEESKWILKIHSKKIYSVKETDNLKRIQGIHGVPTLLLSGCIQNPEANYIIISKASGLDLYEHVQLYGYLSEKEAKNIIKKLLLILVKIHEKKVIHRDIKMENIVYDKDTKDITLIDFEGKSTLEYNSPEQCKFDKITPKTDLWSVGILLHILVSGSYPFTDRKEIIHKKLHVRRVFSPDATDFIKCLLEREELLRYNASEALNHPWID